MDQQHHITTDEPTPARSESAAKPQRMTRNLANGAHQTQGSTLSKRPADFAGDIERARLLPRAAFTIWMLTLTMLPIWIGIDFGATFPIQCISAIMAIAASVGGVRLAITRFDAYLALFLAVSFCAVWLADSSMALWLQFPIRWAIPYYAARFLISATGVKFASNSIAMFFTVVAGLAVIELLLTWHPFIGWANGSLEYQTWYWIQDRGGRDRSEWAFGHSIALGASLAMAVPFMLGSTYRSPIKTLMIIAVGAGTFASGSRAAMAAAALTALASMLLKLRSPIERTAALTALTFVGFVGIPILMPTFEAFALSTTEQQTSFAYRGILYSRYFSTIQWLGPSESRDSVRSTDSAILHLGLNFGWVALFIAIFPLIVIVARVLLGHASAPEVAIFGQIPLFATAALITQYQIFVFFIAGIAVQSAVNGRSTRMAYVRDQVRPSGQRQPSPRFRQSDASPDNEGVR